MGKVKLKKQGKVVKRSGRRMKRDFLHSKHSVAELAQKAWSTAKMVAGLVNVETKLLDTGVVSIPNTSFTNVGFVTYISGIGQGSDYSQRNGNSVKMAYQTLMCNGVRGSSDTGIRILIVRDRENRQATPAVTDILETNDVRSPYAHTTLNRFTILNDVYRTLDTYHPTFSFAYSHTDSTHLYYAGTGTTSALADENAVFALFLSETASGATSPSCFFYNRIGFIDN